VRKFVFVLKGIGIIVGILAAGVLVGWLVTSEPSNLSTSPRSESVQPSSVALTDPPEVIHAASPETGNLPRPVLDPLSSSRSDGSSAPDVWQNEFVAILGSEATDLVKAQQLLDLFPLVPPQTQTDAAMLACDLVPDDRYELLGQYLTNSETDASARSVLIGNLLQRHNSIKIPWLTELSHDNSTSEAAEAAEFLQLFLQTARHSD
jgi:hypothetical protein